MQFTIPVAGPCASLSLALCIGTWANSVQAQTPLADAPLFATTNVPGNLGLLLSVEFPTAVSVAHTNRNYVSTSEYLGLFDPKKCYDYRYVATETATDKSHFYPSALAVNRTCSGKWGGNFLNWAAMQTIDPFRWVLTGGYRVVDTANITVVEKAWASGQGGASNFPNSTLSSNSLAGATPFPASSGLLSMRIQGLGNKMRFAVPDTSNSITFSGQYFNNVNRSGTPVLTRTDTSIDFDWGNDSPDPLVSPNNFSAIWNGTVKVPSTGDYQFQVKADDQIELFVNGTSRINQTSYQSMAYQQSAAIPLTAGDTLTIQVNFREDSGGSGAQLQWKKPGDANYSTMGPPTPSLENTATLYDPSVVPVLGTVYEVFIRAKVCDPNAVSGNTVASLEENCIAYGSNYKPEGLIQGYANKIRYSAFGYLNDSNLLRDGGVLRAKQKFVGPTQPVPGSAAVSNSAAEWSASTGIFTRNPDAADANDTNSLFGTSVADSGVINYLNKFGQITPGSYKTYDNVSELYYAAVRYLKNMGNVPEWTSMTGASQANKNKWADGFPVINTWTDPVLYSCQRNFLLGIGDTNTHADKNVPGNTVTNSEPSMPAAVIADITVNAVTATNKLAVLDGRSANLGTGSTNGSFLMAGLAYDSHTKDIRTDLPDMQTIDTYWVNVQEYQNEVSNNQFYLAAKYGGFTVPTGFDPYARTTPLNEAWWYTSTDMTKANQKRPDNYFSGGRPDLMKAGLEKAFADISSKIKAYTTSFSTSLPQVSVIGNKSYSSLYNAADWSGEIVASTLSFDPATFEPTLLQAWTFTDKLATQLGGTGWNTGRRVATWNGITGVAFRSTGTSAITSAQLSALDTSYVTGNDASNYLNYLRGDKTHEDTSTVSGSTKAYRTRAKMLGDIVGSKARPIGPPNFPFSDAVNPGYSAFKTLWKNRPTVIYVGSNDGMLHAVHGDLTTPPGGTELFAYVPSAVIRGVNGSTPSVDGIASLGNPSFSHRYLVNATPNVYDIDFGRTPDDATKTARIAAADWRSVLIGGLGKGGKSYYAIDVTDPAGSMSTSETTLASKVLWEFSADDDAGLGFTYGDPVVVKTKKYGWVVIFPSGYNNTSGEGQLLIVNPRTGKLLEKISTGVGTLSNSAGLAHANAFVVDGSDGTADAVYAGDLLGNLWRWDLTTATGAYPAPVKMASLTDANNNPLPVTSRPVIEVHPSLKKRFVMLGTGRLLDTSDIAAAQQQSFFAISDGINARFNVATDLPTGITFPITRAKLAANTDALAGVTINPLTQMGWYEDLGLGSGIGWRMTNEPSTLLGSVAFATILPNGSTCSPSGDSRVYARDFGYGKTTVKSLVNGILVPAVFVSLTGNVTDLRYLSVNGKGTLITGTDTGNVGKIETNPVSGLGLRRLNIRELQLVQ